MPKRTVKSEIINSSKIIQYFEKQYNTQDTKKNEKEPIVQQPIVKEPEIVKTEVKSTKESGFNKTKKKVVKNTDNDKKEKVLDPSEGLTWL